MFGKKKLSLLLSLSILLVCPLIFVFPISQGKLDFRVQVNFEKDEKIIIVDQKFRDEFSEDDSLYILFRSPDLYSKSFLKKIDQLTQTLKEYEEISDVQALTNIDHVAMSEDGFDIRPVADIDQIDEKPDNWVIDRVKANRFMKGNLVSQDYSSYAIRVVPTFETTGSRITHLFEQESAKLNLSQFIIARTGGSFGSHAQVQTSNENIYMLLPIIVLVGLCLIWWLYRKFLPVALTFIGLVNTGLFSLAIFPLFGQPFTIMYSICLVILSALGIGFAIHLFNSISHMSKRGISGQELITQSVRMVRNPSFYSALTTSFGLFALYAGDMPPVRWLGIACGLGVLHSYLITIYIFPIVLRHFDNGNWPQRSGFDFLNSWISSIAKISLRYQNLIICTCLLIFVASIPLIASLHVETNILKFFRSSHPFIVGTKVFENELSGTTSIEVYLETDPDALKEVETLKSIIEFEKWAVSQPEIDFVMSHAGIIEEMEWAFSGDRASPRIIPDNQDKIDQYLLIYSGNSMWDFVNRDFSMARIPLRVNIHGGKEIEKLVGRIQQQTQNIFSAETELNIIGIGRFFAELTNRIVISQMKSLGLAFILIFAFMCFFWRNTMVALACMIPNLGPIMVASSSMFIFSIWLDFATSMFASLALGIAVDDTIHIFHSFRNYYKKSGNTVFSIARAYRHSGRAVLATTIILAGQYSLVLSSSYLPFTNFSFVMIVSLVAALVFDLMLLPVILLKIFPNKSADAKINSIKIAS